MNSYMLAAIGLCLIFLEFYLPGTILAIVGGLFVMSGIIVYYYDTLSPVDTFVFFLGSMFCVVIVVRFALWCIRYSKPEYSIYSDDTQQGYQASRYDHTVIGKVGVVLSDLKPGGYILISGKQHQAISQSGYIPRGTEVIVLGGQEESLIVKHTKKDSAP